MISRSFRSKVILSFIVSVALVMLTLIGACNFIFRPILIYNTKESMVSYSGLVTDAYESGSATIKRLLDMLDSSHDIQSVIYSSHFEIEVNSSERIYPESYKMTMLREWMEQYSNEKAENGTYFSEIEENTDNLARVVYISRLNDGNYLCMSKVVKGIDEAVDIATLVVTVAGIVLTIIGIALWSVLTKPFTSQLKKMSQVTKNMAQLNFDEKINYKSTDEVGVLAQSIDEMSTELRLSINKLQKDVDRRKRLIRDISHELKTPVTTVRGYTENIQILIPDNARVQKYCDIMLEECDVINNLVQEMLYMSRIEDETFECNIESISTAELKNKLLMRMENEFSSENIIIDFEECEIRADITLMNRALLNFIKNAVRYREKGSDILVRGYSQEKAYVFAVTNKGEEISLQDKEAIWDVFYKMDKSRTRDDSGHGIGLAIVKRIADLHGGSVDLISENGENTFFIKLNN